MKILKRVAILVFSLFSISGYAELLADKDTLDGEETATISIDFEEPVEGDLYVATFIDGTYWFLNNDETGNFYKEQVMPVFENKQFLDELEIVTINAQDIPQGTYTLFQIIAKPGSDPFNSDNWLPTKDSLNVKVFTINLTIDIPIVDIEPQSGEPNTGLPGVFFTPTLKQRALGDDYIDVVNSKEEWDNIANEDSSEELKQQQKQTLYWEGNLLLGWVDNIITDNTIIVDNITQHSYKPTTDTGIKITIAEPLTSSHIMGYPGCAGISNLETHPRSCGEFNPQVFIGSEVFSQRWKREHNLDVIHDPIYSVFDNPGDIPYDLSAFVDTANIMKSEDLKGLNLMFELSVSKVPGDFSDNACKLPGSLRYHRTISVRMTQEGLGSFFTDLPENCIINSEEQIHYYVNVRGVHVNEQNKTIEESLCNNSSGCKFEIITTFDDPCEYELSLSSGEWECKQ